MSYASIDPIIHEWVRARRLTLFKQYKESEVRAIDLVNQRELRCQIWLDEPDSDGKVGVHAWDYKHKRNDYEVTIDRLSACLDQAYNWCQTL